MFRRIILKNVLLSSALIALVSGCSQTGSQKVTESTPTKDVVHVCTKSKEIFTGPLGELPAMNPLTGAKTLQRGLYCKNCKTWHAVPPLELIGGNQGVVARCSKTNMAMTTVGPVPEEAISLVQY